MITERDIKSLSDMYTLVCEAVGDTDEGKINLSDVPEQFHDIVKTIAGDKNFLDLDTIYTSDENPEQAGNENEELLGDWMKKNDIWRIIIDDASVAVPTNRLDYNKQYTDAEKLGFKNAKTETPAAAPLEIKDVQDFKSVLEAGDAKAIAAYVKEKNYRLTPDEKIDLYIKAKELRSNMLVNLLHMVK